MTSLVDEALQKEKIISKLDANVANLVRPNIYIYETIDSTNEEAKRIIKKSNISVHGSVLLSEHQTAGKGRLGKKFYSPPNRGIYVSVIYSGSEFMTSQKDAITITVSSAVAVKRALKEFGVEAKIKWVNDLFVEKKKICGILTEGVFGTNAKGETCIENYIIGIGVNVLESEEGFPSEIKNIAGSMGKNIDRNILAASILNNIFSVLSESSETIIDEYRKHSMILNTDVTVVKPNESYTAKVLEITDDAHLIVEKENGEKEELLSGEISLRL